MGYIGNQSSEAYSSVDKQVITGNGGTAYTLSHPVANANEIEVFVNNVRQEPGVAYTVSGTALTMTGNVESTDDFYVVFQGKAIQTTTPPDGSVTSAKLDTNIEITGDLTVDTDTLHVDAANNRVGVGTTSPTIDSSLAGLSVSSSGTVLHVNDGDGASLKLTDPASGANRGLGLTLQGTSAAISNCESGELRFGTGNTERMRILAGGGLTFNGDTAAANALDDYEEGTFTPTITTASSYGQQLGVYTKIGNLVNVQVTMYYVQSGTTMGSIQGLPFALADGNYLSIFLKEWYSFGTAWMTFVQSGATATAGIRDVAGNSLTASNGSTYGWAFSFTYQTT